MKKYILNKYNKLLIRQKKKSSDGNLFYLAKQKNADIHVVYVKDNERYYRFYGSIYNHIHNNYPLGDNVFSEKDGYLVDVIREQTNNIFKYFYWLFKYREENIR